MRLDLYLVENKYFTSRARAQYAIANGLVLVDGKVQKSSYDITEKCIVNVTQGEKYISLGKFKLAKALIDFSFEVKGKVVADIGASTGGFTEVLLENGCKKVYAIDVGENQLDVNLSKDKRVVVMDKTNAKFLHRKMFDMPIELIVADVSFISLTHLFESFSNIIMPGGDLIVLVKPQFEAGKKNLNKQGVVKDKKIHEKILCDITNCAKTHGFELQGRTTAPFKSGNKNIEYLCRFRSVV